MAEPIDISENEWVWEDGLLDVLLLDRTTRKHIFWATDSYADYGAGYQWHDAITAEAITGDHGNLIMPRALKSRDEQQRRSRQMAEVFTPAWIVAEMNDVIDEEWSGEAEPNTAVAADADRRWQDYVVATRLEITCGEAPFLTSRYDTVTGTPIPLNERVGILDRKLRSVNEHAAADDWNRWALLALGSVYGYEWQGDNLLLAREALLASFNDYHEARFGRKADKPLLRNAAEIISWNIWQMDGLKAVVPDSCHEERPNVELSLFGESTPEKVSPCPGCAQNNILLHNGVRPQLRRWIPSDNEQPDHFDCLFTDFITKKFKTYHKTKWPMKFDFVIGNPPYQESKADTKDLPLYPFFMDASFQVGEKVELITPARFLFNAGQTSKAWNHQVLNDKHFKVLSYKKDASEVFRDTDIKGGIAITFHDMSKEFEPIMIFTKYSELNGILSKVRDKHEKSLCELMYIDSSYKISDALFKDFPACESYYASGKFVHTNNFDAHPELFCDNPSNVSDYIKIYGNEKGKGRTFHWMKKKYLLCPNNINKWKVLLPKSNGSGIFGETLSSPFVAAPFEGHTQTFISIGNGGKEEAHNILAYLKTKFTRALLGVLKVTQHNPISTWKYVPLQDFTSSSDIDWSKSIHEIDEQLYDKYGLSTEERNFIETHVKEME